VGVGHEIQRGIKLVRLLLRSKFGAQRDKRAKSTQNRRGGSFSLNLWYSRISKETISFKGKNGEGFKASK